jgi:hypothetical protein
MVGQAKSEVQYQKVGTMQGRSMRSWRSRQIDLVELLRSKTPLKAAGAKAGVGNTKLTSRAISNTNYGIEQIRG